MVPGHRFWRFWRKASANNGKNTRKIKKIPKFECQGKKLKRKKNRKTKPSHHSIQFNALETNENEYPEPSLVLDRCQVAGPQAQAMPLEGEKCRMHFAALGVRTHPTHSQIYLLLRSAQEILFAQTKGMQLKIQNDSIVDDAKKTHIFR